MSREQIIPSSELGTLEAPLVLCSASGQVRTATALARALLDRVASDTSRPGALPDDMWSALENVIPGRTVEWRSKRDSRTVLGCTRYQMADAFLVVLSEISERYTALTEQLQRKRLETTGQLVASVAHELRNSIATIVYSADLLAVAGSDLEPTSVQQTANDMVAASRQLQFTLAGLLDYAELGPTVVVPVSVKSLANRSIRFLKSLFPEARPRFSVHVASDARWVRGNFLRIELILFNLLINALQAAGDEATIEVTAELAGPSDEVPMVKIRVRDDGPGVSKSLSSSIFEPFVTTRDGAAGLGLAAAREAAEALDGTLELESRGAGACFALMLPRGNKR